MVIHTRVSAYCTCLVLLFAVTIAAQEPFRYREFQLGSDLATIMKLTGANPQAAKVIHARPAVIKELEWRPRYFPRGESPQTDPVDMMVFRFYEDQLFTVVVDYDRRRTEGMTAADLIAAITAIYGPTSKLSSLSSRPIGPPTSQYSQYAFPDTPLAIWGDAEYSVTLLRVAYPAAFRLVVTHTGLENLARRASIVATKLDADEAPQREIARQKKEAEDSLAAQEKAKTENKAVFRP
jgi:hypothetical protein